MKRPGPVVYLFGNPLSVIVAMIALAYFAYEWWAGGASPWAPFLTMLVVGYVWRANDQVQKFGDWRREWDAMGGEARRPSRAFRLGNLRFAVGTLCWLVFAYLAYTTDDPGGVIRWSFWLTTAAIVLGGVWQWRKARPARVAPSQKGLAVAQCLSPPKQSPDLPQIFAALPRYCKSLVGSH